MSPSFGNQKLQIHPFIRWVFVALVFLVLLTPFMVFPPLLFPFITSKAFSFRILIEAALPFYLYLVVAHKSLRPSRRNFLTWALLIFFAISLLAGFFGANPIRSFWGNFERMGGNFYLLHLLGLYFYILLLAKISEGLLKKFLQGFIIISILLAINGFSGWLGGITLTLDPSLPSRVSSTFGNPIFFASFLILPLALCLYFAVSSGVKWQKFLYYLAALLLLWGIYVSGTRGAVVGLILAVFVSTFLYGLLSDKGPHRKISLIAAGVFIVLAAAGALFASHLPQGTTLKRIFTLRDSNTAARLIQWKMALEGFKQHPLLGVGPENYYVIASKFHNPAINQYDQSWFDKPHNYYLEILDTTGTGGLLAYLGALALMGWGLYRAYREELISAAEFTILLGGFLAYGFQNLFVFDTVSASLAFFVFCGFAGYFFESPLTKTALGENRIDVKKGMGLTALAIAGGAALYLIYLTNWLPMKASRDVNYGYGYGRIDPKKAAQFFTAAISSPFNFDQPAVANRYSDYLDVITSQSVPNVDNTLISSQIEAATNFQQKVTFKVGNDPLLWVKLAEDETFLAFAQNRAIGKEADEAAQKALELAPNRTEPWQALLYLAGYRKDWPTAVADAQKIVELNPYKLSFRIDLAQALNQAGRTEEAVAAVNQALADGYKFQSPKEFLWLIDYYKKSGETAKVAELLEQVVALQPNNLQSFLDLAKAYTALGEKVKAKSILDMLITQDPSLKETLQPYYDALK